MRKSFRLPGERTPGKRAAPALAREQNRLVLNKMP